MQAQDTTVFLLKLWPWVEANKNRLIAGTVAIVVAAFVISFFFYQSAQREIAAGVALTRLAVTPGGPTAEAFFRVATDYAGTVAGQRAQLQGAAELFDSGRYAEAQAEFQKFLDSHPDNQFSDQAALGVAACLEAQGKPEAVSAYQQVADSSGNTAIVCAAKFALGRIEEAQGKFNEALNFYQDVARLDIGTSLGSEAEQRATELRSKLPASASTPAPTAPFELSH